MLTMFLVNQVHQFLSHQNSLIALSASLCQRSHLQHCHRNDISNSQQKAMVTKLCSVICNTLAGYTCTTPQNADCKRKFEGMQSHTSMLLWDSRLLTVLSKGSLGPVSDSTRASPSAPLPNLNLGFCRSAQALQQARALSVRLGVLQTGDSSAVALMPQVVPSTFARPWQDAQDKPAQQERTDATHITNGTGKHYSWYCWSVVLTTSYNWSSSSDIANGLCVKQWDSVQRARNYDNTTK